MSGVSLAELWEQLSRLPVLLAWHVVLVMIAVGAGLLISLPAGILAARASWFRGPALLVASVVQTIPSLALLALVYALLVLLRGVLPERYAFSALGFWPTIIALTLYSVLPMLRNTVAGLRGVDPAAVEAGTGLGMTSLQRLTRIELPLALPVLVAGLRTAVVWTVGIATLSTPIGQPSLGDYIFKGLQTFNTTALLVGCLAAAGLAITLDLLVGAIERAAARRRWRRAAGFGGGLAAIGLAGVLVLFAGGEILRAGSTPRVVVGTKNFSEQFILGHLIEERLRAAGFETDRRESLGSVQAFEALAAGDLDAYVDYTGTLWANVLGREPGPPPEAVLRETGAYLLAEKGVTLLGPLGFENAYALAMPEAEAERRGIRTIGDLATRGNSLRLGSDVEFFDRPEWSRLRDAYGLDGLQKISMTPDLMYQAVAAGDVDLITAFTSDARIARFGLRLLEDTKRAFPPYDAVLLLSADAAADERLVETLRPLVGGIDLDAMRAANLRVDFDGWTPARAAEELDAGLTGRE